MKCPTFFSKRNLKEFLMTKNKTLLIGCIAFPVILIVGFIIGFVSTFSSNYGAKTKVPDQAWLRLNPTAMIGEYNEYNTPKWLGSSSVSANELIAKIGAAKSDKRIKGMLIEPGFIQTSYPTLTEIGLAIEDFKQSGKPVVAFGTYFTQGDYLLASFAKQIYMEPSASAGLLLEGVSANVMFYKELLAKLGIKMHILQSGAYKGAGEPYSQTEFSPGTRENIDAVLLARYQILQAAIAKRRNIDLDKVTELFEKRDDFFLSADKAKEWGLIDYAMGREAMLTELKIEDDQLISIADYSTSEPKPSGNKIAVIYLTGNIMSSSSSEFGSQGIISAAKVKKIVEDISDDKSIKAAVLRINSPGGSALESELIYQQLLKLKRQMPVVISMSGVAASGGYYISCAGDYIIADEATITGSIGVIGLIPETVELGKKLGLRTQTLKHGKYAGAFSLFQSYDPQLIESLRRSSKGTYDEFKSRVIAARKYESASMDSVAEGRVFSAAKAKQNRLIDEIGTLQVAVGKAAALAKLTSPAVQNFPTKTSFWEVLRDSDFMKMKESIQLYSDPAAQLERTIKQIPATGEWQYFMPYKLD